MNDYEENSGPVVYDNDYTMPDDQPFITDDVCPGRHPAFENEISSSEDINANQ